MQCDILMNVHTLSKEQIGVLPKSLNTQYSSIEFEICSQLSLSGINWPCHGAQASYSLLTNAVPC